MGLAGKRLIFGLFSLMPDERRLPWLAAGWV
jgi:hypothetical protein